MKKFKISFAAVVIPLAIFASYLIYSQILGNPLNFEGGDLSNQPLKNNYLGTIYRGGPMVILLISFILLTITYSIERFITIYQAGGKENNQRFVRKIQSLVQSEAHSEALQACEDQKGSLANGVKAGLESLEKVKSDSSKNSDQKSLAVQQELEEAAQLELPSLSNNLIVISTLAQISTLIGLLGTVTGMITAFSALARVGATDAVGLANGISQALVTTALGISSAALAIVLFNYFTTRIDKITYAIDEANFSILHTFKGQNA